MSATAAGDLVMLVVEDNPADVAFFKEALDEAGAQAAMHVVDNGADALRFLRREPPYADAVRPDILVLDLNLPVMNGHEVVKAMIADERLRAMPVAILTTSRSEVHVCFGYPENRCLYFVKTADFAELKRIVRQIVGHARACRERGN
ncbi:MAG: response regulator [Phycisphaerae bacterium]|nr:response regulator [Phycisphaerae bacterium]